MSAKNQAKWPPRLEIIQWADHCSYSRAGWKDFDDLKELTPAVMHSVGWVVQEDNKKLVIMTHTSRENGNGTGEMCIIKSTVQRRWRISDPSAPKKTSE